MTSMSRAQSDNIGFGVVIVASGPIQGGLVYAVAVSQPVQSWTILRSHDDFKEVAKALSPLEEELPSCPPLAHINGDKNYNNNDGDLNMLIQSRNEMQEWLTSVLMYPGARESQAMQNFLTYGANIIPPHFEGVNWVNFTQNAAPPQAAVSGAHPTYHLQQAPSCASNLDDMEMDDMFADDDHDESNPQNDDYDDDDDDFIPASVRYKPTDEAISQEDEDEIMALAGEVEMVEDVGSLAQSLGASHLGRSLQLQAEIATRGQETTSKTTAPVKGLVLGAAVPQEGRGGGIGSAMERASKIQGLSHSFHQKRPVSAPRLDSFRMIKVIGKGSFGKVFLVREIKTGEMFALKVLKKDNIIKRNQVEHTKTERSVLGYVQHPFIVGMNMAFQSKEKLYFVLDYCAGGELFFHLGQLGKFQEPRARFYSAEIILAISYVHSLDIIYRDLKPENVLLDAHGHVRLTDFGLSKEGISNSSSGANSFCGTPEYLAPEILDRKGHGRAVDWWSLGALLYEMLTGLPPFYCQDREKLFEKIRNSELHYPPSLSRPSEELLRGLLTRDPNQRLGSGPADADAIKNHEFFASINWKRLSKGQIAPPWVPKINGSSDTSQFDKVFTSMPMVSPQNHSTGTTPRDNLFEGFTFTDRRLVGPGAETSY